MLRLCSERSCFYTPQGGTELSPGRSASLSSLIGVVEPSLRGIVLTQLFANNSQTPRKPFTK
jgi:hypothetical protein